MAGAGVGGIVNFCINGTIGAPSDAEKVEDAEPTAAETVSMNALSELAAVKNLSGTTLEVPAVKTENSTTSTITDPTGVLSYPTVTTTKTYRPTSPAPSKILETGVRSVEGITRRVAPRECGSTSERSERRTDRLLS